MQKKIKEDIVERTTQIFKLLGDPTRFRMLYLLEEEWNVNAIALELNMEQSAVSHQLKKLKQAKLVKSRRVGKNMLYSQDDSHVFEILEMAVTHATHTTHPEK
ncbi:metalloregulator ArsR/SmtB family transcription factor [Jeotgalibaca sp. MA1X17-3]|nr:metalloregulator ArsR/SmtB family transcription factor [Jeotgalibaca sp. MA1X17-3]